MTHMRKVLLLWAGLVIFSLLMGSAAAQEAPRVPPQEPGPDGGLVHVVNYGDTVQGIMAAYANYGITLDTLKELNGWRFPPDFIFVGQEVVILPPGSVAPGTGVPVPASAPAAAAPAGNAATPVAPVDGQAAPVTDQTQPSAGQPFVPKRLTAADLAALSPVEAVAAFLPSNGVAPLPAPPTTDTQSSAPVAPATNTQPPAPVPAATEDAQSSANPTESLEVALAVTPTPTITNTPAENASAGLSNSTQADTPLRTPSPETAASGTEESAQETPKAAAPSSTPEPTEFEPIATEILQDVAPTPISPEVASLAQNTGTICVTFFDDTNQNTRRDGEEGLLQGGQVLIDSSEQAPPSDEQPFCIPNLNPGTTLVQALAPDGYGLTTAASLQVEVSAGRSSEVSFGAAQGFTPPNPPVTVQETLAAPVPESLQTKEVKVKKEKSLLDRLPDYTAYIVLGAAAVVLLFGGAGVLLFMRFLR